jgi:hypothetical protein
VRARAGAPAAAQAAVQRLLKLAQGTEKGAATPPETQQQILAAVDELKRAGAGQRTGAVPEPQTGVGWGGVGWDSVNAQHN